MNIAILGGAFNPPHLGHVLIAEQTLEFADVDEVWLTPCYRHTFLKDLAPVADRVAMTKILVNTKIKYCNEEIKNKLSGDTIELMEILEKNYPSEHFFFLIGSDNLPGFKRWGRWQELITKYDFLVYPRPGFTMDLSKYGLDNPNYRFKLIDSPLLAKTDISSTMVRERIKKGLSITHLVTEAVEDHIFNHHLYR